MPLETVKLRGTKFDRVGVQSRITRLGLLGRAFSSKKTSLVSLGVMQESTVARTG